ncbi:MAG: FKBP-type peptidyl-prolyl cis-trans isomerase [Eubacterium sp.]|nr:FKBP-type peptidyl-prolyl cis-trans isomerase [Eubacterium sp.]
MFKKLLAIMLTVAVAFGLVGCGSSDGEIKLAKYKGVVVYKDDVKVTDADVQSAIDNALSQSAKEKKVKKGKVGASDKVNVDYKGQIEYKGKKEAFEGGTAKAQDIDLAQDAQNYIEGFTSSIVGHKVGDKFTAKMKFPKTYTNKAKVKGKEVSLAGKPVWFTFKINSLVKKETPKLNDKFVKENAKTLFQADEDITTVKALKKYIKTEMRKYNISNKIMGKILEDSKVIKYNKDELDKAKKKITDATLNQYAQQFGGEVTLKAYLKACQMSKKQWNKQLTEQAKQSVKQNMFIREVCKRENLNLSDKEYKKEAKKYAEQSGMSLKEFEKQQGKDEIEIGILAQKVQDFIIANVKEKKGSEPTTTPAPMTTKKAKTTKKVKK